LHTERHRTTSEGFCIKISRDIEWDAAKLEGLGATSFNSREAEAAAAPETEGTTRSGDEDFFVPFRAGFDASDTAESESTAEDINAEINASQSIVGIVLPQRHITATGEKQLPKNRTIH
jgi:hypothetical protein